MPTPTPIVIAHRGASGYLPEHTLAAYELAARQGADYLEPDVVPTRDGVLVVRHENDISGTTDVAEHPELADRRTTKVVDGREITGWFTEDLTLAEIRTLRARERLPHLRGTTHDGRYDVATLDDVLALRERLALELGREIGVYVEAKHPTYFAGLGLALEESLLAALRHAGLDRPEAPAFVQCFELGTLRRLRHELGAQVRQVFLATGFDDTPRDEVAAGTTRTYGELLAPDSLTALQDTVDGLGPRATMLLPHDDASPTGLGPPTTLLADAHAAGLVVHPWTFRAENHFLPAPVHGPGDEAAHGDLTAYLMTHLEAGVDGIFTDHPDLGVAARDAFLRSRA